MSNTLKPSVKLVVTLCKASDRSVRSQTCAGCDCRQTCFNVKLYPSVPAYNDATLIKSSHNYSRFKFQYFQSLCLLHSDTIIHLNIKP